MNRLHKLFDAQKKRILVGKELQWPHYDLDNNGQLDNQYNLSDPRHCMFLKDKFVEEYWDQGNYNQLGILYNLWNLHDCNFQKDKDLRFQVLDKNILQDIMYNLRNEEENTSQQDILQNFDYQHNNARLHNQYKQ